LLSSGIDSAILAALLPADTPSYTIRFEAPAAVDEVTRAAEYARLLGKPHHVVTVTWRDYLDCMPVLMRHKQSPLHAVEVGLYRAAQAAAADGCDALVVGNGADSTFGGLDRLLSREWRFEDFVARYTFVPPERVLRAPVSMQPVFAPYQRGDTVDVQPFLATVHGRGIIQAFKNAIECAGCHMVEPFETMRLAAPLDLARIRNGEPKYLLRELFSQLYPGVALPPKVAFARPMEDWLREWPGVRRDEFRADFDASTLTGEQRWLVYCLDRFLDLLESP
jgi:asparagine synthetase B (glutamine-hydrolysing)